MTDASRLAEVQARRDAVHVALAADPVVSIDPLVLAAYLTDCAADIDFLLGLVQRQQEQSEDALTRNGMCGAEAPTIGDVMSERCELRAGHDGWHEGPRTFPHSHPVRWGAVLSRPEQKDTPS